MWQSDADADRESQEDRAIELFSALADRLAARGDLRELDAFREARFEQHVVEALDVALFRSDQADLALIVDAPDPEAPVFVIAELWARRRPTERESAQPISISGATTRAREILALSLLGADREACTHAMTERGFTVYREWEDAIAMWRETESASLAFHDGRCDLVAVTLGELPTKDADASALARAVGDALGARASEAPSLDAIEQVSLRVEGGAARVIADAATATLRLEIEGDRA